MPDPPTVLIIGDSISLGYTPHAGEELAPHARVLHNPGNGGVHFTEDGYRLLGRLVAQAIRGALRE
jgi:lysophospholipase L1-like esterase